MVRREVIAAKIAGAQDALARLREKGGVSIEGFLEDRDRQDIILHNLRITIQACIDIASHIVSDQGWELPPHLPGLFDSLRAHKVITDELAEEMRRMAGFRNILVHEYEKVDLKRAYQYLQNDLIDFDRFFEQIANYAKL